MGVKDNKPLWELKDGRKFNLVTPREFHALKDGTQLLCIDGKTYTKGKDEIDEDTRGGYMAFGLEDL